MRKYRIMLLVLIALCIFSPCNGAGKKEVQAVVEEFPNYIFHVLTIGKIVPEDAEYLSLYQNSIPPKDRLYLQKHRDLLCWGDGNTGALSYYFLFIPGYINFGSQREMNEYFDLLSKAVRSGNPDAFIKKYHFYLNRIKLMFGEFDYASNLRSIKKYSDMVTGLAEIYKHNYPVYHAKVWPIEKEKLGKAANQINAELQKRDLIRSWEKLLGLKFKTDQYQIVLFSANQKGPSANSLGYDRNAFYYGQDTNELIQFISHEVGTHLLNVDFHQVYQMHRFEYSEIYRAYETLAEFYNARYFYKGIPMSRFGGYDVEKYYQIYTDLHKSQPALHHQDLLIKGLEIYTGQKK